MQKALHIKTQVLPGKKIEIQAPELTEGDTVDIFVVIEPKPKAKVSAIDILEKLPGKKLFQSPQEVDQYLKEERSSWER